MFNLALIIAHTLIAGINVGMLIQKDTVLVEDIGLVGIIVLMNALFVALHINKIFRETN